MASSSMETSGIVRNRLQQYKAGSKTEPEDIRITRKLLEGIKLRRKERDNQVKISDFLVLLPSNPDLI